MKTSVLLTRFITPLTTHAFLSVASIAFAYSSTSNHIFYHENIQGEQTLPINSEDTTFTDPLFPEQWYFRNQGQVSSKRKISGIPGADIAFPDNIANYPFTNQVTLAIIDSGIPLSHPDFDVEKILVNSGEQGLDEEGRDKATNNRDDDGNGFIDDIMGWNFADNNNILQDSLGHGSHLTGLLAAKTDNAIGIAAPWRGFRILPIRVFSGAHPSVPSGTTAAAIRYAVHRGARVISASFGTPSFSPDIQAAVAYANDHDVLFVGAAGNFRKNLDVEHDYPSNFGFANQIVVGSSERRDLLSDFSNFGKTVDISAPGEDVLSFALPDGYIARSGTSQACPLVAATAAMLRSMHTSLTSPQIKSLILAAADQRSGLEGLTKSALRLNVANALEGRMGIRFPNLNENEWTQTPVSVESKHPYRGSNNSRYSVIAPLGTKHFRIHFAKISTQSQDRVNIIDAKGHLITQISGVHESFWSPVLDGESAQLELQVETNTNDWGFSVDSLLVD